MRSMTGFGQASGEDAHHRAVVTLRGVNHRYLDVSPRLREEHRGFERPLRDVVASRVERGRVEVVLEVEPLGTPTSSVSIDESLLRALNDAVTPLAARGLIDHRLHFADLLRLPDLVRVTTEGAPSASGVDEVLLELALDAARRALDQLVESKEREGALLREALAERLDSLATLRDTMAERAAELPEILRTSLAERLESLLSGVDIDPQRLAQEAAVLVDRSDVREELDRLASHLEHYRELLGADGAVGKRLDFLSQEVFRELNTIGSKCRDARLTRLVLDGKVLCEQLREQVQNVE